MEVIETNILTAKCRHSRKGIVHGLNHLLYYLWRGVRQLTSSWPMPSEAVTSDFTRTLIGQCRYQDQLGDKHILSIIFGLSTTNQFDVRFLAPNIFKTKCSFPVLLKQDIRNFVNSKKKNSTIVLLPCTQWRPCGEVWDQCHHFLEIQSHRDHAFLILLVDILSIPIRKLHRFDIRSLVHMFDIKVDSPQYPVTVLSIYKFRNYMNHET